MCSNKLRNYKFAIQFNQLCKNRYGLIESIEFLKIKQESLVDS